VIIVVDTNILFCACIAAEKTNKLSDLLYSSLPGLQRISCYYAIAELFKHQERLIKISKLPLEKLNILLYETLKQVEFYNEDTIQSLHWEEANRLTKDVDSKDITFVPLALQTGGLLWTGDKKLSEHLRRMGFDNVVNTPELYAVLGNI